MTVLVEQREKHLDGAGSVCRLLAVCIFKCNRHVRAAQRAALRDSTLEKLRLVSVRLIIQDKIHDELGALDLVEVCDR